MEDFKSIEFKELGERTTVCCITLNNNYEAVGTYICKKQDIDDKELRQSRAKENALNYLQKKYK